MILILSSISLAVKIECHDDGSIEIIDSTKKGKVSAKERGTDDPYIPVPGKWWSYKGEKITYHNFQSEEAQFIVAKPTRFYIKLGRKSRKSVTCPTFKFSCKAMNSTVQSCYRRNNTFYGRFMIYNIPLRDKKHAFRYGSPFSLEYTLYEGMRRITHSPTAYSPEFKEINMTVKKLRKGNKYTMSTGPIAKDINRFSVSYQCKNSIFYAGGKCTNMPTCRYDGDCNEEEFCKENICEKVDCGDCQYAEDHECQDYPCCEDSDCNDDQFCENNACIDLNCTEQESIIDHSCNILNCKTDEITVNHECVKLECEEYEQAIDHICVLLRCRYDEHIVDHRCEKLKCRFYQRAFDHDCLNPIDWMFAERK